MNYGKKGIRNKQKSLNSKSKKWGKKTFLAFLNLLLLAFISVGIIALCAGLGVFKGIIDTAPEIGTMDVVPTGFSTFVYDVEGNELTKLVSTNSNRIMVSKEQIPQNLAHAFVAIEDERFYEHNGIDIKGIFRAAYVGLTSGNFSEGASTITQQLLKNNVFTDWTSEEDFMDKAKRKIQEQYLALELEKMMSKEDILTSYMNSINLGQNTLGIQAASLRYFNKPVKDLTLSECSVIAAITQNPTRFNPITNPDKNDTRRQKVLGNMLEQGYINEQEYEVALADDVYSRIQVVNQEVGETSTNTYFVDALIDDIMEDLIAAGYNETQATMLLYSGGLKIQTTLDPKIQAICDEVFSNEENYPANVKWYLNYELTIRKKNGDMENHSTEMFKSYFAEIVTGFNLIYSSQEDAYAAIEQYKEAMLGTGDEVFGEKITLTPQPQVSITVEDQSTGHVAAMVGGRGAKEGSRTLNRAADTKRQPGSTFKIVAVYAPAFDSAGLTLATVMNDAAFNYAEGKPVNNWWGEGYRGINSLRTGIKDSMNIIAVKTLTQITPQLGFDYLQNFGFTTLVERKEVTTASGSTTIFSDINQSLALGGITNGVKNIELNAAYAAIANNGTYIKPKLYTTVHDHDGNLILDNTMPESKQVIKESTAYLLTDAMVDVVTSGTGTAVNFGGMAIAGKTGTTSDYNDVWFSGYTPYYTATTWTGYDNNIKLKSTEEKALSKKLWRLVMAQIHEELPNKSFQVPNGLMQATVCSRSGKLPIEGICEGTHRTEYFAEGTVPTESCDVHFQGNICQYTNLPATEFCPFAVPGVLELPLIEDASLQSGSVGTTQDVVNEDGSISTIVVPQVQTHSCPHNAEFFATPGFEAIIEQQRGEINAAIAAAQAAAAANAQGAPENTENAPVAEEHAQ